MTRLELIAAIAQGLCRTCWARRTGRGGTTCTTCLELERQRRIAAGLCPCGAAPAPGFDRCSRCVPGKALRRTMRAAERLASGRCVTCGDPAVPGRRRCQRHLDADARRSRNASTALEAARRAAGLCVRCGEPTVPGRKKCQVHLQADAEKALQYWRRNRDQAAAKGRWRAKRARLRAARLATGTCLRCKEPALPDRVLCQRHLEAERRRARQSWATWSASRRDAGGCQRCASPAVPGRTLCQRHLDEAARRGREKQAKQEPA